MHRMHDTAIERYAIGTTLPKSLAGKYSLHIGTPRMIYVGRNKETFVLKCTIIGTIRTAAPKMTVTNILFVSSENSMAINPKSSAPTRQVPSSTMTA